MILANWNIIGLLLEYYWFIIIDLCRTVLYIESFMIGR